MKRAGIVTLPGEREMVESITRLFHQRFSVMAAPNSQRLYLGWVDLHPASSAHLAGNFLAGPLELKDILFQLYESSKTAASPLSA